MATGPVAESLRRALQLAGAPVFVYHGLTELGTAALSWRGRKYWVLAAQFREHLKSIHREGCRVALLHELWNTTAPAKNGKPSVALTFDDGLSSDYSIGFPLLLEAGVRANFFVNTAIIGQPRFLGWRQIAEMQRAGMSFQSHGHDHVNLSRLTLRGLEHQLKVSKLLLEDRLGTPVEFLAAPYGVLNARVIETALQVGYRAVCNSRSWPARPGTRTVSRVAVYSHTPLSDFRKLLTGNLFGYQARAFRAALLYLPKRIALCFWQPQVSAARAEALR